MGKAHRFEETHTIRGKSPEQCFEYVGDTNNATKWVSSASSVVAEGEPGVGRTIKAKASLLGVSMDAVQTVDVYDPPNRYAYSGTSPFDISFDFQFKAAGDDTVMTSVLEVDPGKFFPVGGFIVARTIKKMSENDINKLAQLMAEEA